MNAADANLYEILVSRGLEDRSRVCIETPSGGVFTFAAVDQCSARLANLLTACGVLPGDRVAVQVPKSPQAIFLYLACLRAGAIYLPINTAYTRNETDYFLEDAAPKVMVCPQDRHEETAGLCRRRSVPHLFTLEGKGNGTLAEQSRERSPEFIAVKRTENDIAALVYSSGTTGKPKGAMLTCRNLASNAAALVEAWRFSRGDVLLHALPLFHVHGLFVALHSALLSRSRILLLPQFDAGQVCALLPRATVFMGVPTYYTRLLAQSQLGPEACPGVRLFTSGSAPLLPDTFEEFRRRTGRTILERYGLTETGMNTSNPLNGPRRIGSVGLALPGVELRIADASRRPVAADAIGEIEVRGPNVFAGYWRKPEMSAACFTSDGFFRTGDLGCVDAQGYLSIVGRSKDLIISGGYNVYPKEVEECIDRLEGVLESAVIGMPHPDFGEAVVAVVVPRPGAAVEVDSIKSSLRGTLANYKLPKLAVLTKELPRNTMGKVQKNRLRDDLRAVWQEFVGRG